MKNKKRYRRKENKKKSRKQKSHKKSKKILRRKKTDIYCGNNLLHPDIVNNRKTIGTRLQCFRKGFGVGYNSPVDLNYAGDYEPIDDRRVFCGNGNLPDGYDLSGSLSTCLQKGYGVGKRRRAIE